MAKRISLLLAAASLSTAHADDQWHVITEKACEGSQLETGECLSQPDCLPCIVKDCYMSQWSDWSAASTLDGGKFDCTGLCERGRTVESAASECGSPCKGPLRETQACSDKSSCYPLPVDCVMGAWTEWSKCTHKTGQSTRTRVIITPATRGGAACKEEAVEESLACSTYVPKNCTFSDWGYWTQCSKTCDGGTTIRSRRVAKHADILGQTCNAHLSEEGVCQSESCPVSATNSSGGGIPNTHFKQGDCKMGAWAAWSKCESSSSHSNLIKFGKEVFGQRARSRVIESHAANGFKPCSDAIFETEGCEIPPPLPFDCEFSMWGVWGNCSTTCGSGQKFRKRWITKPATHGGACEEANLLETSHCSNSLCTFAENDCKIGAWSPWSACPKCGEGSQQRNRSILQAGPRGKPCGPTDTEELRNCSDSPACVPVDCVQKPWSKWGKCSKTCGGGMTERHRAAPDPPKFGGHCKPEKLQESVACAMESCSPACKNGTWWEWSNWTACSASCGAGYTRRLRHATLPHKCGFPAVGDAQEYKHCTRHVAECKKYPDVDCKLTAWSEWGACSSTCRGMQERKRVVSVYAHGEGKSCDDSPLKESRGCQSFDSSDPDSSPECTGIQVPIDCVFGAWAGFSPCTVSCGGGTLTKHRSFHPEQSNGAACTGDTTMVESCNSEACPNSDCEDCKWSQWTAWDECTSCEGQRQRRREIMHIGNYCGRKCDPSNSVETTGCKGAVACEDFLFCAWTKWHDWTGCPNACGTHTITRSRVLKQAVGKPAEYLVKVKVGAAITCAGSQSSQSFCVNPACDSLVPQDCTFSTWSAWAQSAGEDLCVRHRRVLKRNNEFGKKCEGALAETKKCPLLKARVDCKIGDWNLWSFCTGPKGQANRVRHVERMPSNGGKPCIDPIKETRPCLGAAEDAGQQDCELHEWSTWSKCTATCLGGTQERSRTVKQQALLQGKPCKYSLQEMRGCDGNWNGWQQTCDGLPAHDCKFKPWGSWSTSCTGLNQRFRERELDHAEQGKACKGDTRETTSCKTLAVDCEMALWGQWTACDTTCGVGQRQRYRQVAQYANKFGKSCGKEVDLKQVGFCNEKTECNAWVNCAMSGWAPWTTCTATCGVAQQMRQRQIIALRSVMGEPCAAGLMMSEAKPCAPLATCYVNCVWGEWVEWSACTQTCGDGHQARSRSILTPPSPNGAKCMQKPQEEVRHCNTQSCEAKRIDGAWNPWSQWSACSASCDDGYRWKSRTILRQASRNGLPAEGDSREVEKCNQGIPCSLKVDCEFEDWSVWASCSATCDGIASRQRGIHKHPSIDGAECKGAVSEVKPCHDIAGCNKIAPACVLSDWTAFTHCSVTCGTGQKRRNRATLHGLCEDALSETAGCNVGPCIKPVDCSWQQWADWGACNVCDGERHRSRLFVARGEFGGTECQEADANEVGKCPRSCKGTYLCSWAQWSAWTTCSTSCGRAGKRTRKRVLQLVNSSSATVTLPGASKKLWLEDGGLEDKVAELYRKSQRAEATRSQQITIAFFTGSLSLLVLFAAKPFVCSATRRLTGRHTVGTLELEDPPEPAGYSSFSLRDVQTWEAQP